MAVDYQASRVSTKSLDPAISSEDVNATATRLTEQTIQTRDRALQGAGAAIGQGLTNLASKLDPTAVLERATRMRALQAQGQDLQNEQGANALRASAKEQTNAQTFQSTLKPGQTIPTVQDLGRSGVRQAMGDSMSYDNMSPAMRGQVDALTNEWMQKRSLVHGGAPGAERAFGKHGDPRFTGQSKEDTVAQAIEGYHSSLREMQYRDPIFRQEFVERNTRDEAITRALQRNEPEVADILKSYPGDKRVQEAAREVIQPWQSTDRSSFTNGQRSLRDAVLATPPERMSKFVSENVRKVESEFPRLGIRRNAQGKEYIQSEADDDMLKGLDKTEKQVGERYLGHSVFALSGGLAGWRATAPVMKDLLSGSWAKTPEQKSLQRTLSSMVENKDVSPDEARAHLVNTMGWGDVDPTKFEGQLGGGKGREFLARLSQARKSSPELDAKFFKGDGKSTGDYDQAFQDEYDKSIDHRRVFSIDGPLAPLLNKGYSEADLSIVLGKFADTTRKSPHYSAFKDQLIGLGLSRDQAESGVRDMYGDLERRINTVEMSFRGPDGRTFQQFSKPEQEQIIRGIGEDLARPYVSTKVQQTGAESRSTSAKLAGRDGPLLSVAEARRRTDEAIAANPSMKDGQARVPVAAGIEIHLDRGEPKYMLRKKADGTTETVPFADRAPDAVDLGVAFQLSKKIFQDEAKANPRPLSLMGADIADDKVQKFLSTKLGGTTTAYEWAWTRLRSQEAPTAEDVASLRDGISKYAKDNGTNMYELKDRLVDAAAASNDPVVNGLSTFLEQVLSPSKDTVDHIKAMEGDSPGAMLKQMGDQAFREGEEVTPGPVRGLSEHARKSAETGPPSVFEKRQQSSASLGGIAGRGLLMSPLRLQPLGLAASIAVEGLKSDSLGHMTGSMKPKEKHEYFRDLKGRE